MTLPGVVLLLVALAAAQHLAGLGRRGRRRPISTGTLNVFSAALDPGRETDLETRRAHQMLRDDADNGAPPRSRVDGRVDGRVDEGAGTGARAVARFASRSSAPAGARPRCRRAPAPRDAR